LNCAQKEISHLRKSNPGESKYEMWKEIGRFGKLAASARNLASKLLFQESGLGKWPPPKEE
jgi:hypothetical protein